MRAKGGEAREAAYSVRYLAMAIAVLAGKVSQESQMSMRDRRERESAAAGQSGDLQGLTDSPESDSESVAELLEEGQSFEAAVIQGIENAPDPDESEVKTHEQPEDDVPGEYTEKDQP
jgi:hypothetical protein